MTERAQREHKRQVGVQRIQIASEARVYTEVGDAGQAEDHQRVQQHALFRLGRPVDIAECRRERDAEQRNGNGVAKVNGECNHVRNTCSFWKACSRYASLMSLKRPRGMGSSARLDMMSVFGVIVWICSKFTR